MDPISTDIFKIKGAALSRTIITLYSTPWLLGTLLLLLPFVAAGIIYDLRWIIVALMLIFIVIPMMLAFLYFYYGFNRISVINSTHHKLEFGSQGIRACLYSQESAAQAPDKPEYLLRSQIDVAYSEINDFVVGISDVILRTDKDGKGFLLLPLTSFRDKQLFTRAIDMMTAGMTAHNNNTTYENIERQ